MDITIIIPAYNAQDYIGKCLDSVICFSDSRPDALTIECLVVNDGSSDMTAAIVEQYQERDSRIHLIQQENSGVSAARNHGLEQATGRYIMFLDADDHLTEDAYKYIDRLLENEQPEYAAFSYITLYEDGRTVAQPLPISGEESRNLAEGRSLMYADSVFNTCWGKLFLRDKIRQNNIMFCADLSIGEDFLFVAQYFSHCNNIYMSRQPILYYLQRRGSAMRSYSMEKRLAFTQILYTAHRKLVEQYKDVQLTDQMAVYYLKVLTNLMLEYALILPSGKLEETYRAALATDIVQQILDSVHTDSINSQMKRMEYKLLRKGNVKQMSMYFRIKSKFRK